MGRSGGHGTFTGRRGKGFKETGSRSTCLTAQNNGQLAMRSSSVINKVAYGFKMMSDGVTRRPE